MASKYFMSIWLTKKGRGTTGLCHYTAPAKPKAVDFQPEAL